MFLGVLVLGAVAMFSFTKPVAAQQRTMTRVVAIAKPKAYNGPAPARIEFIGTIFVSKHPVVVQYQWERSDGAKGERKRIEIRSTGQGVSDTWTLGQKGKRMRVWEKLNVLAPTGISSAPAVVTINCR